MTENNDRPQNQAEAEPQPVCDLKPQKPVKELTAQEVFDLFLGVGAVMSGVRERIEGSDNEKT